MCWEMAVLRCLRGGSRGHVLGLRSIEMWLHVIIERSIQRIRLLPYALQDMTLSRPQAYFYLENLPSTRKTFRPDPVRRRASLCY
jgi:hypothetical protein